MAVILVFMGMMLMTVGPPCSFRVDEPPGLVELQKNEWDPVLNYTEDRFV